MGVEMLSRGAVCAAAGAAVSAITLGGVLAVCSPQPAPSAAEAQAHFLSLLEQTQDAVGGTWENRDDGTPRDCDLEPWGRGEQYPALRIGSSPRDALSTLQIVSDHWAGEGYHVERSGSGTVLELQGRTGSDELVIFRISDYAMTLQGESACHPARLTPAARE